jgi:hypothetical protein
MNEIILTTPEQLEDIIKRCLSSHNATPIQEEVRSEATYLRSIRELADFLDCSIVTAQKLKNSGKIRYKQYGRKVIFNTVEVLEDLSRTGRRSR